MAVDEKAVLAALRRRAIHEAGHAVVAHAHGRKLIAVSIASEPGAGGGCEYVLPGGREVRAAAVRERLTVLKAGAAAEIEVFGMAWPGGIVRDEKKAKCVAPFFTRSLCPGAPRMVAADRVMCAALRRARTIIQERRAAVEVVAEALLRKERLNGGAAERLIRCALVPARERRQWWANW